MAEIDTQALNKKLAEWAGLDWTITFEFEDEYGYCRPFFTNSLDACFKWLVPKLPTGCNVLIYKDCDRPTFYAKIQGFYLDSPMFKGDSNESPALAFSKAIERLIDETSS
ncbi:hypothetical protein ES703_60422 [subsurface metagenome]